MRRSATACGCVVSEPSAYSSLSTRRLRSSRISSAMLVRDSRTSSANGASDKLLSMSDLAEMVDAATVALESRMHC